MLQRVDVRRWGVAARRSLIAGGCWLGAAIIVSMGEPLVVAGALAAAILVVGGVTWSASPPAVRLVVAVAVLVLARLAAGPSGAVTAFVLCAVGALLRVRLSDAALGLALFAGAVSLLGGADHRLLATFLLLGALTRAIAHLTALFGHWIAPRLLGRERRPAPRLAGET